MSKHADGKGRKLVPVWMGMLVFLLAFGAGAASKVLLKPAWAKAYAVSWSDALGTLQTDLAYGAHDRVQPFLASLRLKTALEQNQVDHRYFEFPHSGHALQNDDALSRQWMEAIEEYLDRYLPVE